MGKNIGAASGRRSYSVIHLAIALLIAANVVMAVWIYQEPGNRVAVLELFFSGWDGLMSLLWEVYALAYGLAELVVKKLAA